MLLLVMLFSATLTLLLAPTFKVFDNPTAVSLLKATTVKYSPPTFTSFNPAHLFLPSLMLMVSYAYHY